MTKIWNPDNIKSWQQELSFKAGENAKCTSSVEDHLAVTSKTKHTLII